LPAQPLIDLDSLDLSQVVVGREGIRRHCKQRNRFDMVDGILYFTPGGELVVGFKEIRSTDWWAEDHIPGRPIFPGVLQIEGAAQMCSWAFLQQERDLGGKFVGFGGLNETRFRGQVVPDCRLVFVGKLLRSRPTMFTYQAQAFVERKMVFESEIIGVVI
jgi:3-hydroxyacyl-[acyl-carrier-protein] dehydratase